MANLDMQGPYPLNRERINEVVTRTSPGNYALGRSDDDTFYVKYVGRADSDVKARLKEHLSDGYSHFKFSYATSPKAAFEKECRNYHDFGESKKLDNKIHPDRPDGSGWKCPCCNKFD